jgi:branched-chain amino acid transport system ATP-binding protein
MTPTPLLEATEVRRRFGGLSALDGVDLAVMEGEICGLIGPNGSGKSTFFNCVSGLLKLSGGQLRFAGEDIGRSRPPDIARRGVGRSFQLARPLPALSCTENLLPGLLYGEAPLPLADARVRAPELLAMVGLEAKAGSLAGDLTLWEQKALEVARAMSVGTRLLLLDEPFAGLSPADVTRMVEVVRRIHVDLNATILLVEHVMRATMALCDRIYVLSFGQVIASGTPREVVTDETVIEVYLGPGHRTDELLVDERLEGDSDADR